MKGHRWPDRTGLVRRRLLEKVEASLSQGAVVLCAPCGFGKTTLLEQFTRQSPAGATWLVAAARHVQAADFFSDLVHRLRTARPELPDTDDIERLLTATDVTDLLLVIDDAHCLENSEAETFLERLLARPPSWLRVAVATRHIPGFTLARYELSGIDVITADQLCFRAWEIEQLLSEVYREPLPPADVAALDRRTGGWPAGLHLYHLSTRGRGVAQRRAAVAALDGRTSVTRSYLARNMLADLSDPLRDFLIRTSVFDVVTADRCDRLMDTTGSWRHLAELERRQVFITGDGDGRYRYHQAMRSHLLASLSEDLGEEEALRWHADAAGLLRRDGAIAESARAYARAEEWPMVRHMLDHLGVGIITDDVEPWRELLPEALVAGDPWLVLAEGRQLFHSGRLAAAVRCLERGERMFDQEEGKVHCRRTLAMARIWLPGPARGHGHWASWLRAATQRNPAVVSSQADYMGGDHGILVRTLGRLLAGEPFAGGDIPDPAGHGVTAAAVRLCRLAADLLNGDDRAAGSLAEFAAEINDRSFWLARIARAVTALDGSEAGGKTARKVAEECRRDDDDWGSTLAQGMALVASLRSGAVDSADVELAAELVAGCRRLDAAVLEAWARAIEVAVMAALQDPEAGIREFSATAFARRIGVPAAQHLATAAVAAMRPPESEPSRFTVDIPTDVTAPSVADLVGSPDSSDGGAWRSPPEAANPPDMEVWSLGGFQMRLSGRDLRWGSVKPRVRSLLRMLAMHAGRPVHREVLAAALWPDADPRVAAHSLHVALSSLRKLLEPGAPRGRCRLLLREGDTYRLALPEHGDSDVTTFRDALRTARRAGRDTAAAAIAYRSALDAYGGDLLPEDGAAEWVVPERELLKQSAAEIGITLARIELARGDLAAAAVAAARGTTIDRYHDSGWRLLIDVLERQGDRAAARDTRSRYNKVLAELGLSTQR